MFTGNDQCATWGNYEPISGHFLFFSSLFLELVELKRRLCCQPRIALISVIIPCVPFVSFVSHPLSHSRLAPTLDGSRLTHRVHMYGTLYCNNTKCTKLFPESHDEDNDNNQGGCFLKVAASGCAHTHTKY